MKTIIKSLTVAALFISMNSYAQTEETTSNVTFGVKGGASFSNMYTEDVNDENALTGFTAGIFTELPLNKTLSLQPELNYTNKGSELTYDNALAKGSAKFKLDYLELPVLLKINLTENFNIHVGPYAAYLLNSKITNETENGTFDFENNIEEDDLNRFDYGLSGGLGFDFGNIGIGARYNYGLATVGKEKTILGQSYTYPDGKNSALNVYLTVKF